MEPFSRTVTEPGLPAVVGHRGAPRVAPENTPEGFAAAAAAGATWVELDVRVSGDGLLVVHHDAWLPDRVPVVERTLEELRHARIWGLADVLDGLPASLGVDLEVKNLFGEPDFDDSDRVAGLVAKEVSTRLGERPWMTSSFNPATVAALASALPDVPAGLVHSSGMRVQAAAALATELGARVLCSHVDAPDLGEHMASAHAEGLAVMVWTIDDPLRARAVAQAGADAICTNDAARIVAALARY